MVGSNPYPPRQVAPHAGAWIETLVYVSQRWAGIVAPHAGAWIETNANGDGDHELESRPARARGLKHGAFWRKRDAARVAPHAGAWIETGRDPA